MEHELIDWYDKNGNHMGVIDKAIAHKKGLWHKSIHVWIINDKNQILMQKRCSQKKFFPNFWDCSFAGHVSAGENSIISAIREGEEELGLKLNKKDFKYAFTIYEVLKWGEIKSKEFVDVFIIHKNVDIKNLNYQKEEVESAKYFDANIVFENKVKNIFPHKEEFKMLRNKLLYKEKYNTIHEI